MTDFAVLPPHDLESEENVVGACMLAPRAIEAVVDVLDGNEFYSHSLAVIFRACISLWERNQPVDGITVVNELSRTGLLEQANGANRVHEVAQLAVASSNAAHYAGIVRAKWLERELAETGAAISVIASNSGSVADKIAEADGLLGDITAKLERKRSTALNAQQLVTEFRERIATPEDSTVGVPTPFPTLLRPLKPKRLYVLGGYQGDGKTLVAVQFLRAACEAGKNVGFMSIEMGHEDLVDRLVATFGVPHHRILDGDLSGYEDEVEFALAKINAWNFTIDDDEELTPSSIRRAQRRGRYDFLIVDHVHRMKVDRKHIRESTSENVVAMTSIAKRANVPVLLLAQLSRGQKHDPFPRPTMADFRETSAIESEAAMALFIWRLRDDNNVRQNQAELIVDKNRFGSEGFLNLNFKPSHVKFESVR